MHSSWALVGPPLLLLVLAGALIGRRVVVAAQRQDSSNWSRAIGAEENGRGEYVLFDPANREFYERAILNSAQISKLFGSYASGADDDAGDAPATPARGQLVAVAAANDTFPATSTPIAEGNSTAPLVEVVGAAKKERPFCYGQLKSDNDEFRWICQGAKMGSIPQTLKPKPTSL